MLCEISFGDGSKAEYEDLASTTWNVTEYTNLSPVEWNSIEALIEKHNKPFTLTPIDSNYHTDYYFPTDNGEWLGMYFSHQYTNNTSVPIFIWVKETDYNKQISAKKLLRLFQSIFDSLPKDLDPIYAV